MEDKLLKVKHVFDKVKNMRSELNLLFNHLDGRICKLSEIYDDFIKNTNMINIPSTHKDPSYRYKMPKMDLR